MLSQNDLSQCNPTVHLPCSELVQIQDALYNRVRIEEILFKHTNFACV